MGMVAPLLVLCHPQAALEAATPDGAGPNFFCNLPAFFFQEEVNETQFGD
jgi:hypothetical protein